MSNSRRSFLGKLGRILAGAAVAPTVAPVIIKALSTPAVTVVPFWTQSSRMASMYTDEYLAALQNSIYKISKSRLYSDTIDCYTDRVTANQMREVFFKYQKEKLCG